MATKSKVITINIPLSLLAMIDEVAAREGRNRSQFVTHYLGTLFVERYQTKAFADLSPHEFDQFIKASAREAVARLRQDGFKAFEAGSELNDDELEKFVAREMTLGFQGACVGAWAFENGRRLSARDFLIHFFSIMRAWRETMEEPANQFPPETPTDVVKVEVKRRRPYKRAKRDVDNS